MHKKGLKLTLCVVTENHAKAEQLIECIWLALPIYLLLKYNQQHCYQDRAEILNQKDQLPRDLQTQILKH